MFSSQCYIQERKGHAKLTLNSKGIDLTLGGGSVLQFPIGTGNNLPFMLTVEGLNQQRKRHGCPHSPTGSPTASLSQSSSFSSASSDSNFGLGNYFEWNDLITRANFFGQSLYPSIVSQSFTPLTDHHVLNENNINLTAA